MDKSIVSPFLDSRCTYHTQVHGMHNSGSQIRCLMKWEMQTRLQPNLEQIFYT